MHFTPCLKGMPSAMGVALWLGFLFLAESAAGLPPSAENGTLSQIVVETYTIVRGGAWLQAFVLSPTTANLSSLNLDVNTLIPVFSEPAVSLSIASVALGNVSYNPLYPNVIFITTLISAISSFQTLIPSLLANAHGTIIPFHTINVGPGFLMRGNTSIAFTPSIVNNTLVSQARLVSVSLDMAAFTLTFAFDYPVFGARVDLSQITLFNDNSTVLLGPSPPLSFANDFTNCSVKLNPDTIRQLYALRNHAWSALRVSFPSTAFQLADKFPLKLESAGFPVKLIEPQGPSCRCEAPQSSSLNDTMLWAYCKRTCTDPKDCPNMWSIDCGPGQTWVKSLCSCVPTAVVQSAEFYSSILADKVCPGAIVGSAAAMEVLRFCTVIDGPLSIANLTPAAAVDFSPLAWISQLNGYLQIVNNTIPFDLTTFYRLSSISANGHFMSFKNQNFTVVINGNTNLSNADKILDIFDGDTGSSAVSVDAGVYVAGNPGLCMSIEPVWAGASGSYLEFYAQQCPLAKCYFLDSEGRCTNVCRNCGSICLTTPITDASDLAAFTGQNCTLLLGGLVLRNLPQEPNEDALSVFSQVARIAGPLVIDQNSYLLTLSFLQRLRTAESVTITSNTNLIDARLPSLDPATQLTVVETKNYRLCPSQRVINQLQPGTSTAPCATRELVFTLNTLCPEFTANLSLLLAGVLQVALSLIVVDAASFNLKTINFRLMLASSSAQMQVQQMMMSGVINTTAFAWQTGCHSWIQPSPGPQYTASVGGYNEGLAITDHGAGQTTAGGIQLSWSAPVLGRSSVPPKYIVSYREAIAQQNIDSAMQILLQVGFLDAGNFATVISQISPTLIDALVFWTKLPSTTGTSLLIPSTMLSPEADYDIKVTFYSDRDTIDSPAITVNTADVTLGVKNFVSQVSDSSISLHWDTPSDPLVVAYELAFYFNQRGDAEGSFNYNTKALLYTTTVLRAQTIINTSCFDHPVVPSIPCIFPFTTYYVTIRVLRSNGLDGSSQGITIRTAPSAPHTPPEISLAETSSTSLTITVAPLVYPNGHVAVYVAQYTLLTTSTSNSTVDSMGSVMVSNPDAKLACNVILANLLPFSTYSVTLIVITSGGSIATQFPSIFRTAEAVPTRLAPPAVIAVGNGVLITWMPPVPFPGIVTYEVAGDASVFYRGNQTSVVLEGVSTSAKLKVRAITSAGVGPWSLMTSAADVSDQQQVSSSSATLQAPIIGVVVSLTSLVVIAVVIVALLVRHHKQRDLFRKAKMNIPKEVAEALSRINGGRQMVPRQIPFDCLNLLDKLGEGKFGTVHKALLDESKSNGVPSFLVAVKMSKTGVEEREKTEMLMEAVVMAQFSHQNIVNLIGHSVCSVTDAVLVISQFCEHGNLSEVLTKHDSAAVYSLALHFATDIASGMAYMAGLGFVHRDLAARNVLVDSSFTAKISDFGFTRIVNKEDIYEAVASQIAVRWSAPEAISKRIFCTASDVWSYGVVLYEIFTFGEKPYKEWSNGRVWLELLNGYRLPQPSACPDFIYRIMLACWADEPTDRPTFGTLVRVMSAERIHFAETCCLQMVTKEVKSNKGSISLSRPSKEENSFKTMSTIEDLSEDPYNNERIRQSTLSINDDYKNPALQSSRSNSVSDENRNSRMNSLFDEYEQRGSRVAGDDAASRLGGSISERYADTSMLRASTVSRPRSYTLQPTDLLAVHEETGERSRPSSVCMVEIPSRSSTMSAGKAQSSKRVRAGTGESVRQLGTSPDRGIASGFPLTASYESALAKSPSPPMIEITTCQPESKRTSSINEKELPRFLIMKRSQDRAASVGAESDCSLANSMRSEPVSFQEAFATKPTSYVFLLDKDGQAISPSDVVQPGPEMHWSGERRRLDGSIGTSPVGCNESPNTVVMIGEPLSSSPPYEPPVRPRTASASAQRASLLLATRIQEEDEGSEDDDVPPIGFAKLLRLIDSELLCEDGSVV